MPVLLRIALRNIREHTAKSLIIGSLVVLGVIIGPHVLGLTQFDGFVATMFPFAMAVTLFMAGMELDFGQIRGRPLSLGAGALFLSFSALFLGFGQFLGGFQLPLALGFLLGLLALSSLPGVVQEGFFLAVQLARVGLCPFQSLSQARPAVECTRVAVEQLPILGRFGQVPVDAQALTVLR